MLKTIARLIREEDGQALSEYGVIIALVALASVGMLTMLSGALKTVFQKIKAVLSEV